MRPRGRRRLALLIDTLSGDYEQLLRAAVVREARARDLDLLVVIGGCLGAPAAATAAMSSVYELVGPASADGAIVVSARLGIHVGLAGMSQFCATLAPLPMCSLGIALPGVPSIVIDNGTGMERVVEHLIVEHGASRIAFICGPGGSAEAEDRRRGYLRALERHGLPQDDQLIAPGNFTVPSGTAAMHELLGRGVRFDAVVAANDGMAFGAMEALRARGLRVPRDVRVAGFDDATASRFTMPPLTTVGQPFNELGALAVSRVVDQLDGKPVDPLTTLNVRLVTRQSCGCSLVDELVAVASRGETLPADVRATLDGLNIAARQASVAWGEQLLRAAERERSGEAGVFLTELENLLDEAAAYDDALERLQMVISVFRRHLGVAGSLGDAWHRSRLLISAAAVRVQGRQHVESELTSSSLRRIGGRLSTALSLPAIKTVLAEELPVTGSGNASVALWNRARGAGEDKVLEPLLILVDGVAVGVGARDAFPAELIVPPESFPDQGQLTLVVMPLTFEADRLGVVALELGDHPGMYDMLRDQLGAAIKSTLLHQEMVRQMTLRERLEREHLEEQSRLAQRVQTTILPTNERIPGLEISATMVTATNVGGDYYDFIPTPRGGWLGIGDVSGHGLAAGLVMLMVQSTLASLVAANPEASPTEILAVANRILVSNVRQRMKRDDHVTLTLLRYDRDGTVTFAGAHEEIIVHRARRHACELIPTPGVWLAAWPEIGPLLGDRSFRLEDGDVLLLHTDGLSEARDAHREFFGVKRLCEVLEGSSSERAETIQNRILGAVGRWTSNIEDDMTVVVARYTRAPSS